MLLHRNVDVSMLSLSRMLPLRNSDPRRGDHYEWGLHRNWP
jgi:hypothetical protein